MRRDTKKSKAVVYIIILGLLIAGGLYWKYHKNNTSTPFVDDIKQVEEDAILISISTKEINEKNFTGKVSVISGESILATKAQAYIDQSVSDFKKIADVDVPDIIKEFGADTPAAQYEIIIEAKYIESKNTESVSMLIYQYTGGAHGNSIYNVITASKSTGEILTLSHVIKKERSEAFTNFVKKELLAWRPYESTDVVVFTEEIDALTFKSFTNWSQDDENLILYFSQYEIGPGVLGPVAFPIPVETIKDFLK